VTGLSLGQIEGNHLRVRKLPDLIFFTVKDIGINHSLDQILSSVLSVLSQRQAHVEFDELDDGFESHVFALQFFVKPVQEFFSQVGGRVLHDCELKSDVQSGVFDDKAAETFQNFFFNGALLFGSAGEVLLVNDVLDLNEVVGFNKHFTTGHTVNGKLGQLGQVLYVNTANFKQLVEGSSFRHVVLTLFDLDFLFQKFGQCDSIFFLHSESRRVSELSLLVQVLGKEVDVDHLGSGLSHVNHHSVSASQHLSESLAGLGMFEELEVDGSVKKGLHTLLFELFDVLADLRDQLVDHLLVGRVLHQVGSNRSFEDTHLHGRGNLFEFMVPRNVIEDSIHQVSRVTRVQHV